MAASPHNFTQFKTDREIGYRGEEWLVQFHRQRGNDAVRYDDENTLHDVRARLKDGRELRYEVKVDRRAYDWFRACYLEVENGGRPSGLASTDADVWCHIIPAGVDHGPEALFYDVERLRTIAKQYKTHVCGNGPSLVHKVPTSVMRANAWARVDVAGVL